MSKKRNLIYDLDIAPFDGKASGTLDIDIENIKNKVGAAIFPASNERKVFMKFNKKFAVIAAAVVLALGASAFAAGNLVTGWSSHSNSIDYKSLPTEKQCIDDIGYAPVLIDTFQNGYAFKTGRIVTNAIQGENNTDIENYKSVSFTYEKDGEQVYFSQEKYSPEFFDPSGEVYASADGVDIYYFSYVNKFVSGNYEKTPEDIELEERGEVVFSYGIEKDELVKVEIVSWSKEGIQSDILQMDGALSPEELVEMAKESILAK